MRFAGSAIFFGVRILFALNYRFRLTRPNPEYGQTKPIAPLLFAVAYALHPVSRHPGLDCSGVALHLQEQHCASWDEVTRRLWRALWLAHAIIHRHIPARKGL